MARRINTGKERNGLAHQRTRQLGRLVLDSFGAPAWRQTLGHRRAPAMYVAPPSCPRVTAFSIADFVFCEQHERPHAAQIAAWPRHGEKLLEQRILDERVAQQWTGADCHEGAIQQWVRHMLAHGTSSGCALCFTAEAKLDAQRLKRSLAWRWWW